MKKVLIVLVFIAAVVILFLLLAERPHPKVVRLGNLSGQAIHFHPSQYQCSACKMPVVSEKYAAEAVAPDGKTWFFDDVGCLGGWIVDKPFRDTAKLWVYTLDTKRWIDARQAHYTVLENTPMGYGFGAYERNRTDTIDFATMVRRMERGENLTNREYARKLVESRH